MSGPINHSNKSTGTRQDGRKASWLGSLVRMLSRMGGALGLVLVGLSLASAKPEGALTESAREAWNGLTRFTPAGLALLGGLALLAQSALVELVGLAMFTAARRSAYRAGALLRIALALVALVGVNLHAFRHGRQVDLTRQSEFTLPEALRGELAGLEPGTQVVVHQMHRVFPGISDKPDRYDLAAERKILEKVRDLVDLVRRESGASLTVVELDVEDEGYDRRLDELTHNSPLLKRAIEQAPESSLFFHAGQAKGREQVQRLGFREFLRLDKKASEKEGNLVLLPQGIPVDAREGDAPGAYPFIGKLVNLESRRPKVAIAAIHEWLTSRGTDTYGLVGLRKALSANGFEVTDLVLKRLSRSPQPVVSTFEESRIERLEQRVRILEEGKTQRAAYRLKQIAPTQKFFKEKTLAEIETVLARQIRMPRDPREKLEFLTELKASQLEALDEELKLLDQVDQQSEERARQTQAEIAGLGPESLAELRRNTDVQGKMEQLLGDCDLLILPRPSLYDVVSEDDRNLPAWLHSLDPAQLDAVRNFMKSGKPVLFAIGPTSDRPDAGATPPGFNADDGVEKLLGQLGYKLNRQTVLFDSEEVAFSERQSGGLTGGTEVEPPPVLLDFVPGAGQPRDKRVAAGPTGRLPRHPVRESLELAERAVSSKQADVRGLQLRIRHPRPVFFEDPEGAKARWGDLFLSSAGSWNEDMPFATDKGTPAFRSQGGEAAAPGKDKDPYTERRKGPFPIGVAAEEELPAAWFKEGERRPGLVRSAVVGESWWLVGPVLDPARERLAVDLAQWLVGRDDALAREPGLDDEWRYPRVGMSPREQGLWSRGALLGLPVLAGFAGFAVRLYRRLR